MWLALNVAWANAAKDSCQTARGTVGARARHPALKGLALLDLVVCLKTSALAGSREGLIIGAVWAVCIVYLGFGLQRRLAQRITVSVLIAFALLLLGSVYVDCLEPSLS
ncbi:GDT1 family protein [Deinococcus saxicola]|uniref:hypothetical protein n=1 Tax=Deinococcus saxicola TaxID=249406 RepID=UPI0039EEFAA8